MSNKDGKFAWRPLKIIHPALYVSLVHNITDENNWNTIIKRFQEFSACKNIVCCSIPLISDTQLSDKAVNVSNWWTAVEQKSIENSLEYNYILHVDISDCYGSIYTHSVPWSLHTKETAKSERSSKTLIGNIIDKHIRDMSYGQTNGIPQGSMLMDFIAEMVLGFADMEIQNKLKSMEDFKIIRYRDDYRVFANSSQDADLIVKGITESLIELGLRLNPNKTLASNNVIEDSIKSDKLFWLLSKQSNRDIQAHLLLIHNLAKKHPNSGSLVKALTKFNSRIGSLQLNKFSQNISVLISIVVDIAYKNPRVYSISSAILSKLFTFLPNDNEVYRTVEVIMEKFKKLPNTEYMEIWLQRVIWSYNENYDFNALLCKKLQDSAVPLWNSDWLKSELQELIGKGIVVNHKKLKEMGKVISKEEVELFNSKLNYTN